MSKIREMIDSIVNDDFDSAKVALKTTVATFIANRETPTEETTTNLETDDSETKSE